MIETQINGISASSGIAIGKVYIYRPAELLLPDRHPESLELELARFERASSQARVELQELFSAVSKLPLGKELAEIFNAHQEMLNDPLLKKKIIQHVQQGNIVEAALESAKEELAGMLEGMQDELFSARAADVRDVCRRVLRIMLGLPDTSLGNLQEVSILAANDLSPSETAKLNPALAAGICTQLGGLTSHTAILARTLGIPAVVGLGEKFLDSIQGASSVILDGENGWVILNPADETIHKYKEIQRQSEEKRVLVTSHAHEPAQTVDGRLVEVAANIGEVKTAHKALENGADGVGLLRTEFLYLNEKQPPSEEKQVGIYRAIFEVMGQRPVIVRTLDIGGDKPPSYMKFPEELNPYLGWRGLRVCLDEEVLFKNQLRAILRAAAGYKVWIMFPMVSGMEELECAREMVNQVIVELEKSGHEYNPDVPLGIMVETPAAALLIDRLAQASDFFSIGSNDLTQYALAVDRGNAKVAEYYQPLHPAVLRMVRHTIEAAHEKGKWIGMCGELASMQLAIPILLGLGLDEFSMAPSSIPEAKHLIRRLDSCKTGEIARHALSLPTAKEVAAYIQSFLSGLA